MSMSNSSRQLSVLRMTIGGCFAAVLLSAVPSAAQDIVLKLGWNGAPWWVIVLLSSVAAVAIGLVIFYNIRKTKRSDSIQKLDYERLFRDGIERSGLTDFEADKLRSLLQYEPLAPIPAIFDSISLFERCVHAEVGRLAGSDMPLEEKKLESAMLSTLRHKLGFNVLPYEHPLVSTRNISLGQVGAIFGKSTKNPLIQRAVVVENNVFTFRLQYNVEKEESVSFVKGTSARFVFARQNDGFYGLVLTIADADNAGTLLFHHTIDLKRNQLRQYVRIEVSIPLKVRLVKTVDPAKSEIRPGQAIEAKVVDISGGGMGFICSSALKPGDLVSLSFQFGSASMMGVGGKILRISLQEGKTQTLFRHHVEFSTIEPSRREQIVRHVFEKQRQMNQWR